MNEYFNFDVGRMVPGDTAMAEDVNGMGDRIVSGFDKLPPISTLFSGSSNYAEATGLNGNYSIALPNIISYTDGMSVVFKASSDGGPSSLNVNGIGFRSIVANNGAQLVAGDIVQGHIYMVRYNISAGIDGLWEMQRETAGDAAAITTVSANIAHVQACSANIEEIKTADDNAAIATSKASEAANSALQALNSANSAAISAAQLPNLVSTGASNVPQVSADGLLWEFVTVLSREATETALAAKADKVEMEEVVDSMEEVVDSKADKVATEAAIAVLPTVSTLEVSGKPLNGDFQVAQEASGHSKVGYGSIDGVYLDFRGSTMSVSRQQFTIGQVSVPGEPVNYAQFTVNSATGANNNAGWQSRIPDVRNYAGGKVYIAFDAKSDVAGKVIGIECIQNFGVGGSAEVYTPVQLKTLNSTWSGSWIITEVNVPSIAGKVLGTADTDYIAFNIIFDAGSSTRYAAVGQKSGVYDICKFRVVRNLWELNHTRGSYSVALDRCSERFQVYAISTFGSGYKWAAGAQIYVMGFEFMLRKKMTGTVVSFYSGFQVLNCTALPTHATTEYVLQRVNVSAAGWYSIWDGTIKLDSRI